MRRIASLRALSLACALLACACIASGCEDADSIAIDRLPSEDPQIAEVLRTANAAEIETGLVARDRAQDPDVAAFAERMIDEHTDASARLDAIVTERGIGYAPSESADTLVEQTAAILDDLERASPRRFDEVYLERTRFLHRELIDLIDHAYEPAVRDPALRAELLGFRALLASHLAEAEALDATGGSP